VCDVFYFRCYYSLSVCILQQTTNHFQTELLTTVPAGLELTGPVETGQSGQSTLSGYLKTSSVVVSGELKNHQPTRAHVFWTVSNPITTSSIIIMVIILSFSNWLRTFYDRALLFWMPKRKKERAISIYIISVSNIRVYSSNCPWNLRLRYIVANLCECCRWWNVKCRGWKMVLCRLDVSILFITFIVGYIVCVTFSYFPN